MKCPTEIAISDWRHLELANLGFLSLIHCKGQDFVAFHDAQSCQKPKLYFSYDYDANVRAEASAKLNYLLCVCCPTRYLKVLAGDLLHSSVSLEGCRRRLGEWLEGYTLSEEALAGNWLEVSDEDMARRPVGRASLQLRPLPEQPGVYELAVSLQPIFQLEALTTDIQLITQVSTTRPGSCP